MIQTADPRLVCSHPGKNGDVLLSLPVVRELSKRHGSARIVTSAYCRPLVRLLASVPYVSAVDVVSEQLYRIEHTDYGAQPWSMPLPAHAAGEGRAVYHLGFRHFPRLGQTVPELAGEPYDVSAPPGPWLPLVRVDPAGPVAMPASAAALPWLVAHVIEHYHRRDCGVRVIGTHEEIERFNARAGDAWGSRCIVADYHGLHGFLNDCSCFIGPNSGPSIVAMGAGLPVVWAFDGKQEPERWAHRGCDVSEIDQSGNVRRLRAP